MVGQDFFEAREEALKTPEEKKSSFLGGLFKDLTPKPHPRYAAVECEYV